MIAVVIIFLEGTTKKGEDKMRKKLTQSDAKGTAKIAGFFTVNSQKQALTEEKRQEIRDIVEKEFALEFRVIRYVAGQLKEFTFDTLGFSTAPILLRNHGTFKALNIALVKLFKGDAATNFVNEYTDDYKALVDSKLERVSRLYKCEDLAFVAYQDIQVKAQIIEVIDSMLKKAADNLQIEHDRLPREFHWDKGSFRSVQLKDAPVRSALAVVRVSGVNTPPLIPNRSLNSSVSSLENISPEGGSQASVANDGSEERKRPRVDAFALMMSGSAPKKVDRRDHGAGGRS